MSQEHHVKWRIVLPKVAAIPVLSVLIMFLLCHAIVIPSEYFTEAVAAVPSTLPDIALIVAIQFIIGTVLYTVIKYRKRRLAKLSFYLIIVSYIAGSLIIAFYTLYLLISPFIHFHLLLPLMLLFSTVLSIVLIYWFVSECPIKKYLSALLSSLAAALNIVLYLPSSFSLLLIAVMPIVDVLLVYFGPLGKSIQEVRKRVEQFQTYEIHGQEQIQVGRTLNPILRMTVRMDGIMLGIGDFLLYSLATMWSTAVLISKFGPSLTVLFLMYLIYLPLFLLAFYINIRICLKRSYGPAATIPLVVALIFTLACYYFLSLK